MDGNEHAHLVAYWPLNENIGRALYDQSSYMRAEISSLSSYSSLFNSAANSFSWIQAPVELNRNFLCSIGSLYDYERGFCVIGTKKFLRFTSTRTASEYAFTLASGPYTSITVDAWVFPEASASTQVIFNIQSFMRLGFATTQVFASFSGGTCIWAYTTLPKQWTHFSFAYSNTPQIDVS